MEASKRHTSLDAGWISGLFIALPLLAYATLGGAQERKPVTVTGNVVDAACFMIHPQAATFA